MEGDAVKTISLQMNKRNIFILIKKKNYFVDETKSFISLDINK